MAQGPSLDSENGKSLNRRTMTLGSYQVSQVAPEKVAARKRENMNVPGVVSERDHRESHRGGLPHTATIPVEDSLALQTLQHEDSLDLPAVTESDPGAIPKSRFVEPPKHREKFQMWIAIFLAVLLGAALITGLVWIGGYERDLHTESTPGP
jgi:hypothetical protein